MATKIMLYIIDLESNEQYYNILKLNISNKTIILNKNIIEIPIDTIPYLIEDVFIEEIILYNDKSQETSGIFYFPLYLKETNNLVCQINTKGEYLFEIIYYNNYYDQLPKKFEFIKDDKIIKLNQFDKFGLKNVQRITLLNVHKNQLNSKVSKIHLAKKNNSGSYLISKFTIDKKEEIRLHRTRREKYEVHKDMDITPFENDIKDIENIIQNDNYRKLKNNLLIEFNNKPLSDDFKTLVENIRNYVRFNQKSNVLNEMHYKSCLIFLLHKLEKKSIGLYINVINKYNEIRDEINLSWDCKINLLFGYYQGMINPPENNNFIEPELINLKTCLKESAYFNAYNLLKNIIYNISSNSKLFGYFYLCNSGSGCNRFYKNVVSFKLSMVSEKIIKNHLEKLIPEAIYRYSYPKSNEYGFTLTKDGVMFINDGKIFSQDSDNILRSQLLQKEDKEYKYSIPILMSILHELFAHFKNMLREKNATSPTHMNSVQFTFNNEKVKQPNIEELTFENYYINSSGENGRSLEFFISENINIIYILKFSCLPFKELSSYKIWIARDFSNLIEIVEKKSKGYDIDFKKHSLANFPVKALEDELELVEENVDYEYSSDCEYDKNDYKLEQNLSCDENERKNHKPWKF